jgi:hypothetical protein
VCNAALSVTAEYAIVLGLISASSDTVEPEEAAAEAMLNKVYKII